ncbi:MAG: lysylphosphatidylglycerol synthase domain-containing protein [Phycisphaerales bacterium]
MKPPGGRGWSRWRKPAGFVAGLLLIVLAVWVLLQNRESFDESLHAARGAPLWLIALMLVLPVGNAIVVAWSFQVLMNRFGRVPYGDMLALICSAWLLNYLPMRPGLVGRLAYHKAFHGVSLKHSVAVSVALALMTGLAAAHLLAVWVASTAGVAVGVAAAGGSTLLVVVLANIAADRSPAGRVPRSALRFALVLRYLDLVIWAARLWVAFAIVGHPISPMVGVLLAGAIQLAYLFPLTGSGLGVAEWAVGLVGAVAVTTLEPADGIAASLVSRSAELAVAVPLGLLGIGCISARRRRSRHRPRAHNQPSEAL